MKPTTRYSWQLSRMGYKRVSFYYPYTIMTRKPCRMCFTGPPSTWMLKMHCWLVRRSPRRERGRRKPGRIGAEKWQEREIKEMIDNPNPRQGGSQTSPTWIPRLIRTWCRSKMKEPWHFLANWRVIPVRDPRINIVVSTEIIVTTHLNTMTWSSR